MNFYNDIDPKACAWLRELIAAGEIPPGVVDDRSIKEIQADELKRYTQCHFFAGIGGWPVALEIAGWPIDVPVWTGSCPCQPFSAAGKQRGEDDPRHLWPDFYRLIEQCRPAIVFGEQVASKAGRHWYAGVRTDLEGLGYASGAADLCAASTGQEAEGWIVRGDSAGWERITVGPPHIRQRLFWVAWLADTNSQRFPRGSESNFIEETEQQTSRRTDSGRCGNHGGVSDTASERWDRRKDSTESTGRNCSENIGRVDHANDSGPQRHAGHGDNSEESRWVDAQSNGSQRPAGTDWLDVDLIDCRDEKTRRIKSGIEPLVDGIPDFVVSGGDPSAQEATNTSEARVMRLKGFGNAIVPQVAATFVEAVCEIRSDLYL